MTWQLIYISDDTKTCVAVIPVDELKALYESIKFMLAKIEDIEKRESDAMGLGL